jgi:hypothetical protein
MKEKSNEENTIYLVSIRLTELVFITKAKDEKEAKSIIFRHIINNKHTYPHLADSAISSGFLDNILVIPLSSIERLAKDYSFDDVDYVRNVARTIWDLGK